jgi:GrpB-like predicted nucleotidyltransferase (UPF0157 family)
MNLGLEHGINRLSPYSADWPGLFTTEAENILSVCGNCIIAIEHVGSTSIPHMEAKPIVDMVAGVASLNDAEKMIKGMESIGYDYPGDIGIPDDRIFGRDPGFRKFLVHVVVFNSPQWDNYICFRDTLIKDPKLANEYCKLKSAIAANHPKGRAKFTKLKSKFIRRVLEQEP